MNLIQIKQSELKEFRKKQWLKQNKICPILKQEIPFEDSVFDHKHRTQEETIGENGKGLLRGVLHFQVNSFEGKITNAYKRYGLHKLIALSTLLRGLADYLENPPLEQKYIHPKEREKPKKLMKSQYNKIKKYYFEMYPNRKRMPEYPKSGQTINKLGEIIYKPARLTKQFEKILKDLDKYLEGE